MPKLKLTETAVAKLKAPDPSGKQVPYWDTELKGFGVLCSGVSSSKSYIAQFDQPGGKTRKVTIGAVSGTTTEDARKQAWDIIAALRKGEDPKAKRKPKSDEMTLQGALDAYLAGRKTLAAASIASYKLSVKQYLTDWADLPLRAITPEMVEERHRTIAAKIAADKRAKAEEARKRLGADAPPRASESFNGESTANSTMRTLRVLWNFAADRDTTLPANPVRRLKKQWFAEVRRETYVRAGELAKFYKALCALESDVQRDYLKLVLFTGLRRTEAASLTWSDIDFESKLIRISAQNTKAKRKLDLPMSDFVQDLLAARAKSRVAEMPFVFPADSASGHLSEPQFALDAIGEACGVNVGVHDLRRTFITVAESSDISPIALKALVNHGLGGDVPSGYIMMTAERLREPAQRVADRMKQLCGITAAPAAVAVQSMVEA